MSKERPILFSGEMVRAILSGRKSQTRRVVKPQPTDVDAEWPTLASCTTFVDVLDDPSYYSPYGKPGDRLWVKENYMMMDICLAWGIPEAVAAHEEEMIYQADITSHDTKGWGWKPSIYMPRWASRITLEITNIRVERVQDITESDAMAEGTKPNPDALEPDTAFPAAMSYRTAFRMLWDSINGKRGYCWQSNPWVWVVKFKRVQAGGG